MPFMLIDISLFVTAYLAGSMQSALVLCKLTGLPDPRTQGSGNPGATNMLRLHGKSIAVLTLLGDALKGMLIIYAGRLLEFSEPALAVAGLLIFTGHLFPLFSNFRGGKGVATLLGVLLGIGWQLGLIFILIWIAVALVSRYSSLAGLSASILSPLYTFGLLGSPWFITTTTAMAILLCWRHRNNVSKLLHGREQKIKL